MKKRSRGHPRSFESGEELLKLYEQFCEEIKDNGYNVVPFVTEFYRWLKNGDNGADRHTIYLSLHKYYPEIKKDVERLQGETMSQGAMLGKYKETSTIFALKCKCGWNDQTHYQESNNNERQDEIINAIKKAIDSA